MLRVRSIKVCQQLTRPEWGTTEIGGSHALGLFNEGGDGLIIDGTPEDLLHFVDLLHAHAHAVFNGAAQ